MSDGLRRLKADIIKALAHPTRLALVEALERGERCVCELAEMVDVERTSVSKHLVILKNAGIISSTKRGLSVYYRLEVPCVARFLYCIEAVVENKAKKAESLLRS